MTLNFGKKRKIQKRVATQFIELQRRKGIPG